MEQPKPQDQPTAPLLKRLQKYTIYVSFMVAVGRELKTSSLLEKALISNTKLVSENEELRRDRDKWKNEATDANGRFTRLTDRLYPKGSYGNTDSLLVPSPVPPNKNGAPSGSAGD